MNAAIDRTLSSENTTSIPAEKSLVEAVAHIQNELNDLIGALGLLGIQRCSRCRRFFRSSDAGALFDCGELVCFECVPNWWHSVSGKLSVTDREKLEVKLSSWLRKYHQAQVIKQEKNEVPTTGNYEFETVVHCNECNGSGKLLEGERCRFCNGYGKVRIVIPS
jgi:hypothetical protein